MDTVTAVRNRILSLCGERGISINQLAVLCALPPSSIKNILYPETERCRTPHGVRGLKSLRPQRFTCLRESHPARGAWIEMGP